MFGSVVRKGEDNVLNYRPDGWLGPWLGHIWAIALAITFTFVSFVFLVWESLTWHERLDPKRTRSPLPERRRALQRIRGKQRPSNDPEHAAQAGSSSSTGLGGCFDTTGQRRDHEGGPTTVPLHAGGAAGKRPVPGGAKLASSDSPPGVHEERARQKAMDAKDEEQGLALAQRSDLAGCSSAIQASRGGGLNQQLQLW